MIQCAMVILNYKDSERAAALAKKTAAYAAVDKVVIVDNDSQDGSYEKLCLLKSDKIDVIRAEENLGFAAGNNVGARYVAETYHPQYIVFANTDTIFPEENLIRCREVMEQDAKLGLVSTRMYGPNGKEQKSFYEFPTYSYYLKGYFWLGRRLLYKKGYQWENYTQKVQPVDIVRGSFMFFRGQALTAAGYFDEGTFLYCEETVIAFRLKQAGYGTALLTDCSYIHDHQEAASNKSLMAAKRLYESRYYYAVTYWKIGIVKRLLMKVFARYSLVEMWFIEAVKRCWTGGVF